MGEAKIEVELKGEICNENVRSFINDIKQKIGRNPGGTTLNIYISSPGGNVDMAVELFNFLRLLDYRVRTINMSCVNSAAVVVFAAGAERISLPCASFYIHSVTKKLNGSFTAEDLLREVKEIAANTDKIAEILADASNKSKSYWKRLMRHGCLLTAKKSKELGLTNDISEHKQIF